MTIFLSLVIIISTVICFNMIFSMFFGCPYFLLSKKQKQANNTFAELVKDEENLRYKDKKWFKIYDKTNNIRISVCESFLSYQGLGLDTDGFISWSNYKLYKEQLKSCQNIGYESIIHKHIEQIYKMKK